MKRIFFILIIVFVFIGCKDENEETGSDDWINNPVDVTLAKERYRLWASASKSHSYSIMKTHVAPNSNFEGMTEVCKESWDRGNELYYTFSNLTYVEDESSENAMAFDGSFQMIQGNDEDNLSGTFQSYVKKVDGSWLLHGMNMSFN